MSSAVGSWCESTSFAGIPFHGDTLEAVQRDGKVWVSVKRVCESLGIDLKSQHRKLQSCSWAVMVIMTTTAPDGQMYETSVIQLDSLPMWLATINVRKVAEDIRPKLTAYQREAAEVLRRHFLGDPKPSEPIVTLAIVADSFEAAQRLAAAFGLKGIFRCLNRSTSRSRRPTFSLQTPD